MDMRLELVPVPVSDVDRAKSFYVDAVGFHADHDHTLPGGIRFVQLTPPGSACSIAVGAGIGTGTPGCAQGLLLVVDDVDAVREGLVERGVEVTDVRDEVWGSRHAYFQDPDGNSWQLQQPQQPQQSTT